MRALPLGTTLALVITLAPADPPSWESVVQTHLQQSSSREGLERFLAVYEALGEPLTERLQPHSDLLGAIQREGWKGNTLALEPLLDELQPVFAEAHTLAAFDSVDFPAATDFSTPVPNFLRLQLLFKAMAADARRLEAQGRLDEALARALDVTAMSSLLQDTDVTMIQHLIGVAGMSIGLRTAEAILPAPGLSEAALRDAQARLMRLDARGPRMADALQMESECMIRGMRQLRDNPDALAETLGVPDHQADDVRAALADFARFEAEHARVWDQVIALARAPYWEQAGGPAPEEIVQQSTSPLIRVAMPNFLEAGVRETVARARLRLCLAVIALRLGEPVAAMQDPFTGLPLGLSMEAVRSLGPDREDQHGALLYDPTNGTLSPGDVVAAR